MSFIDVTFPHVMTANSGPLYPVEEVILNQVSAIEAWFRSEWKKTPAPITSSVDLRHACFKLAPVDTNLFPAGFNNLKISVQIINRLGNRVVSIEYDDLIPKHIISDPERLRQVIINLLFNAIKFS